MEVTLVIWRMRKEPARQRKWVGRRYPRGGDTGSREGWEARVRLVEGPEGSPTWLE